MPTQGVVLKPKLAFQGERGGDWQRDSTGSHVSLASVDYMPSWQLTGAASLLLTSLSSVPQTVVSRTRKPASGCAESKVLSEARLEGFLERGGIGVGALSPIDAASRGYPLTEIDSKADAVGRPRVVWAAMFPGAGSALVRTARRVVRFQLLQVHWRGLVG